MNHLKLLFLVIMTAISTQATAQAKLSALWNFENYTANWTVSTKTGDIVPFRLTVPQRYVYQAMQEARNDQGTRIRLLKTRRMGASTMVTAMIQHYCQTRQACSALSIADKKDLPSQWMRRAQGWLRQTDDAVRPHTQASNAIEMWYNELGNRYSIGSQESVTPGMGDNIRFLHLSELGFWSDPDGVLKDLNPSVPKNDPTVVVAQESTGDMAGSWWEEAWWAARRGDDDYTAIFVPWSMDPDNRMDPKDIISLTSDEQERMRIYDLDKWQIAWFRWIVRNEYKGDAEMARSRYPQTPEEAFLAPGRAGIPLKVMNRHRATAIDPIRRVTLVEIVGKVRPCEYTGSGPCWWVWEEPRTDCDYCIGADVAEGGLSDPNDERSERDDSAAAVLNRVFLSSAAEYVGQITPDEFKEQLKLAYRWYNEAWIMPESNTVGLGVVQGLMGLKHLYTREGMQDAIGIKPVGAYGWRTTSANRDYLIDSYVSCCWNVPGGLVEVPDSYYWEGTFNNLSTRLADQERTFVTNKNGKREHRVGKKDDVLFAWMLAFMAHVKCPRGATVITKLAPPKPGSYEWHRAQVASEDRGGQW